MPASSTPLTPPSAPTPPAAPPAAPLVARATRSSARTAALNRTRAVLPRALIFDSGASSGTFVRTLKAKGWLIDVATDSSTTRDVTVRSVQRELRDNIENSVYDHVVLFAPPIAILLGVLRRRADVEPW